MRREIADVLIASGWKPATVEEQLRFYIARQDWNKCAKLGQLATPRLITIAAEEKYSGMRVAVIRTLADIGDPQAVECLITTLSDDDGSVRLAAVEALGKFGDLKAIEPLIGMMLDTTPSVCQAAIEALITIGEPAVLSLIDLLDGRNIELRYASAYILGKVGDPRSVAALIKCLEDKTES